MARSDILTAHRRQVWTTRGVLRKRAPKGFTQMLREKLLRAAVARQPEAIDRLWRSKKWRKAKREKLETSLRELPPQDKLESMIVILSRAES